MAGQVACLPPSSQWLPAPRPPASPPLEVTGSVRLQRKQQQEGELPLSYETVSKLHKDVRPSDPSDCPADLQQVLALEDMLSKVRA